MNTSAPGLRRSVPLALVLPAVCFVGSFLSPACGGGKSSGGSNEHGSGSGGSAVAEVLPDSSVWIDSIDDDSLAELHPIYTVVNVGPKMLTWTAHASEPWISFAGASQGQLDPGQSVPVGVDVDAAEAASSDARLAVGYVTFVDSTSEDAFADRTIFVSAKRDDPGGSNWTTFTPSTDTRAIYVSGSTGNDAQNGLSERTAKRTIAAGKALLRHGYPDWLLLKRGDTWQESLGQWKTSGRSESEPMVVGTYGSADARPLLRTGTQGGIWTNGGGGSPSSIDNVAIIGLHFQADGYTGNGNQVGASMLLPSAHVLFEDCMFQAYGTNVVFQGLGGRHTDFRLRRSVIVDAYAIHGSGAHPQGLYCYAVDGLLVEGNVFDHNGWSESVSNAGADIYSHNLYIDNDNTGVVVRGNIIANASSHGMQLRPGGVAVDNLFVRNSIALSVGGGNNPEPAGVTAEVHQNVILDGKNIDGSNARGWALWFGNIASGHVTGNVVAHNSLGTNPRALNVEGDGSGDSVPYVGVHDLAIEDNVFYDWGGNIVVQGNSGQITNVDLNDNDVQDLAHTDPMIEHLNAATITGLDAAGNRFYSQLLTASAWTVIGSSAQSLATWKGLVGDVSSVSQQAAYADASRTLASYNALVGGTASLAAFMAEARLQSATNWRPEYTATQVNGYIRDGFAPAGP